MAAAVDATKPDDPLGGHGQAAAMELASAGEDVAARWRHDPEEAVALVQELVASGEFTEDELLDDAVDCAVLTGLLTLQEVRTASDPSAAAELCLHAVPHIALAVTLASADMD
jgi:predicted dinucleotide-binding enzyme